MKVPRSAILPALLIALTVPSLVAASQQPDTTGHPSILRVQSGTLVTSAGIPIQLLHVTAKIAAGTHKSGQEKDGDPPKSEVITIDAGAVLLKSDSLTRLLNDSVAKNGKLKDLKVTTDKNQNEVHIMGKAKKGVEVPFELKGPVRATPNGQIQLDATSVKAADIPGLASLLGLTVQKAAGTHAAKGVKTQSNTIVFNPDQLWGLPVHGFVRQARIERDGLLLVFGQPGPSKPVQDRR